MKLTKEEEETLLWSVLHIAGKYWRTCDKLKTLLLSKHPEDPIRAWQMLYRACPTRDDFREGLHQALRESKDPVATIDQWTKLLIDSPSSPELLGYLSEALSRTNNRQLGIDTWTDLVRRYPSQVTFYSRLFDILETIGDDDLKERTWTGLAETNPGHTEFQKRLTEVRSRKAIQQKNAALQKKFGEKWDSICPICMELELSTVFIPCGHVSCGPCLQALLLEEKKRCHICRSDIDSAVKPHAHLLSTVE